ncbi:MAG: LysR family transcriptional regulator [Pseudomonadota bacterium]
MHAVFLRYLDETARQGSIRKAANLLNVSSTSINRNIIQAERKLGVKVFDRTAQGVELTPAGHIILEHCRKTLYDFESVKAAVDDIRDLREGHLKILTLDSATFGILPAVLESFHDIYPGVSLSIQTAIPDEILSAVLSGAVDIGVTFTNDVQSNVRVFSEKAAPFGVLVPPNHPLAERGMLSVEDLTPYPLVSTIDARTGNSILDDEIAIGEAGLKTHIYTNTLEIAKRSILNNQAIGIYTKIGFIKEIQAGDVRFIKLAHSRLSRYKVGLVISSSANVDPLKHAFFRYVEKVFKQVSFD